MNGRVPITIDGYTLQHKPNKAGEEAKKDEYAHYPDRPAEVLPGEDSPVEQKNAIFNDGFGCGPR